MKLLRLPLLSLLILALLGVSGSIDQLFANEPTVNRFDYPANKVLREGAWELRIWYRAKGTRSEGQHGVLYHNGQMVKAAAVGKQLETSLGNMKYYGATPAASWEASGWHFADSNLIRPSTFCP